MILPLLVDQIEVLYHQLLSMLMPQMTVDNLEIDLLQNIQLLVVVQAVLSILQYQFKMMFEILCSWKSFIKFHVLVL
jgi:hypothetical protein